MTQHQLILKRLNQGWTTPLDALSAAGTMKLATRVGELRVAGYAILDKWVEANGKRFKAYRIVKQTSLLK
tara:strand:- start:3017 stop:3226 length:210 start_codon:yes stop_codon:yes gene_type:complete